jgi:hypothetical protein
MGVFSSVVRKTPIQGIGECAKHIQQPGKTNAAANKVTSRSANKRLDWTQRITIKLSFVGD